METQNPQSERVPGIPPALRVLVACLGLAAAVFFPAGFRHALAMPLDTVLWIGFLAAANLLTIPAAPKWDIDASLGAPVSVAAAVVLPAPLALLVNFLGFTNEREWHRSTSLWLVVYNRSQMALSAGAASVAATVQPWGPIVGTAIAVVVYNIVNIAAVTLYVRMRRHVQIMAAAKTSAAPFPRFMLDFGLVTLLSVLIVIAHDQVRSLAVLLLALPLWLGYSALRSARESEDRAEQLAVRVRDLETLHALGTELLTARDQERARLIGLGALRSVLGSEEVEVSATGAVDPTLQVVAVPGAEPVAIGVPPLSDDDSMAVVEAIAGLLGMALQRMRLERELGEVERARTALSGQILEEGTRERSRIALEIHDDVLPYLAAAEIQGDNVRSALRRADADRADELAQAVQGAIHGGIKRLRDVLTALQRQIVVPGRLRSALVEHLEELRIQAGVSGALSAPDPLPPLPLAVEILVLETVRGCLANVGKHAEANHVDVRIDVADGLISLEVRDDGRGFDPAAVPAGHHGIGLMAQRVELARGRFTVRSEAGKGTSVHVEVPV